MFSRRKLFQMFGAGSAAVVAARLPLAAPASMWTDGEIDELIRFAPLPVSAQIKIQQQINRRRSEMIRLTEMSRATIIK